MGRGPHTDNILLKKSNKETRERERKERELDRGGLYLLSSVSRRVEKCWLEVKGRRKVNSALTSDASWEPGTVDLISSLSRPVSHDLPFTRVRWYPTPYLHHHTHSHTTYISEQ